MVYTRECLYMNNIYIDKRIFKLGRIILQLFWNVNSFDEFKQNES